MRRLGRRSLGLGRRVVPFRSEKQRAYLFANHPTLARKWVEKYGAKPRPKRKVRKRD
jgi:hypothetical protein